MFAFSLGLTAGLILKRVIPAMAVTLGGFLAVRVPVEAWLRPHYVRPLVIMFDPIDNPNANRFSGTGTWQLGRGFADASGQHLNAAQTAGVYQNSAQEHLDVPSYLHLHDLQRWYSYQPASRFWTFQLIEGAVFLTLTATLIAVIAAKLNRGPT